MAMSDREVKTLGTLGQELAGGRYGKRPLNQLGLKWSASAFCGKSLGRGSVFSQKNGWWMRRKMFQREGLKSRDLVPQTAWLISKCSTAMPSVFC